MTTVSRAPPAAARLLQFRAIREERRGRSHRGWGSAVPSGLSPLRGSPLPAPAACKPPRARGCCGKGGRAASSSNGFLGILVPILYFYPQSHRFIPFPSALLSVWYSACQIRASHVSSSATPTLIIHLYSPVFCLLSCPFYSGLLFYVVILFISTLGFSFIY